jgi:hypothetical protein
MLSTEIALERVQDIGARMIDITIDTAAVEKKIRTLAEEMRLGFGDFRDLFLEFDAWLSGHLKKNFNREGPNWAPLARATRRARLKGWGYYGKRRSGEGPDHRIGRWTHGAYRRAQKKGKALRTRYVRDFGPRDFSRDKLHWLHTGGPFRPPRRLYRQRVIEKEFVRMVDKYANTVVQVIENKLADLGPGIAERLESRFL